MKIRKLIFGILLCLALLSAAGSLSMIAMLNMNQSNGRVVNYSGVVRGGAQRIAKLHLLGQPTDDLAASLEQTMDGLIDGSSALGLPNAGNSAFGQKMKEVRDYWDNIFLKEIIHEPGNHNIEKLQEESEKFFALTNEAVALAEEQSTRGIIQMKLQSVIILLINLLFVGAIGLIVKRKVLSPLSWLEEGVAQIAQGDLSTQINYQSNDELGTLAFSMRHMVENLNQYIGEIQYQLQEIAQGNLNVQVRSRFQGDFVAIEQSLERIIESLNNTVHGIDSSADQVAMSSSQVADSIQSLAEGASQENQSMETLTDTVSNVSSQIDHTANNAAHAGEMVQQAKDQMEQCGQQMERMVEAMARISESTAGIEKITKTIEDISFQTNILALNAAVEAARAGAAGKGFAVVADEVRALANKSGESVKDTAVLVQESLVAVENGNEIADQTAQMLRGAVAMAQEATGAVNSITEATAKQSQSLNQIMEGIHQITHVVHTNSGTTQESAAAGEELSSQAQLLKELVSQFRLRRKN